MPQFPIEKTLAIRKELRPTMRMFLVRLRLPGNGNRHHASRAGSPHRISISPQIVISRIVGARDGTLWIGTWNGLASRKNGKLIQYAELGGSSWPRFQKLSGVDILIVHSDGLTDSENSHSEMCSAKSGCRRSFGEKYRMEATRSNGDYRKQLMNSLRACRKDDITSVVVEKRH
jgi:hypothetical protein